MNVEELEQALLDVKVWDESELSELEIAEKHLLELLAQHVIDLAWERG